LLAGAFAIFGIVYWLLSFTGIHSGGVYLRGMFWHSHEMVFGFAVAVISGFLLTAVRNWTGLPTPTGLGLAGLVMLWLAGRVMIVTGPALLAALVDVLFIPLLAIVVARVIFKSRNQRNYKIVGLLALLTVVHVVYHLAFLGGLPSWLNHTAAIVAIELITILFALIAGRVIPAFTKNAIAGSNPQHVTWLEYLSFGSLLLITATTIASDWMVVPASVPTVLIVIAAVSHFFRLAMWQPQKTLHNPLLWMMPVAYSWLPIALFLRALAQQLVVAPGTWIHALTMGAISSLMLAMMMRSSLGHTGRQLAASGTDMAAFLLLQLAAVVRVAAGLVGPELYRTVVISSGAIWIVAFGLFLLRYVPMLTRPRIDGRPG